MSMADDASNKRRKIHAQSGSFTDTLANLDDAQTGTYCDAHDIVDPSATWERPPLAPLDATQHSVVFQQIDVEECQLSHAVPEIRMYGATQEGHPVLVHVHGFLPYFYVHAPRGFFASTCADLKNSVNASFGMNVVADVALESKKNLMQYTGPESIAFLKITVSDLRSLPRVRGAFERGEISFRDLFVAGEPNVSFDNVALSLIHL